MPVIVDNKVVRSFMAHSVVMLRMHSLVSRDSGKRSVDGQWADAVQSCPWLVCFVTIY